MPGGRVIGPGGWVSMLSTRSSTMRLALGSRRAIVARRASATESPPFRRGPTRSMVSVIEAQGARATSLAGPLPHGRRRACCGKEPVSYVGLRNTGGAAQPRPFGRRSSCIARGNGARAFRSLPVGLWHVGPVDAATRGRGFDNGGRRVTAELRGRPRVVQNEGRATVAATIARRPLRRVLVGAHRALSASARCMRRGRSCPRRPRPTRTSLRRSARTP